VRPGQQVKVTDAPTFFGSISYTLNSRADGATLSLANHWKDKAGPTAVVFHIPWFVTATSATIDGKAASIAGGAITLPPNARTVEVHWRRAAEPTLTYDEAVRLYLEKYYRKPAGADYDF